MANIIDPLEIEVIQLSRPSSPKLPITPKPASKILSEHSVLLHPEQEKLATQPKREQRIRLAPEISEVDTKFPLGLFLKFPHEMVNELYHCKQLGEVAALIRGRIILQ